MKDAETQPLTLEEAQMNFRVACEDVKHTLADRKVAKKLLDAAEKQDYEDVKAENARLKAEE